MWKETLKLLENNIEDLKILWPYPYDLRVRKEFLKNTKNKTDEGKSQ